MTEACRWADDRELDGQDQGANGRVRPGNPAYLAYLFFVAGVLMSVFLLAVEDYTKEGGQG
jgi:hypothetical protein